MNEEWMVEALSALDKQGLRRQFRQVQSAADATIQLDGRTLVNFSSNNYLGLANHPVVVNAVREGLDKWGVGSGASALVSGYTEAHEKLCRLLAEFEHAEDVVLFPTGFQANVGVIGTLAGDGDRVILDKLNHASLIDGARLSGAEVRVYPHNHLSKLESLLQRPCKGRTLVVTDSVFSMDGDLALLEPLCGLCEKYGAMLMVDEAHGTGVLGETGAGLCELEDVKHRVSVRIGTLSKALGGVGGFAVGSKVVCDLIRNRARSLIYTTAMPAVAACAAKAALEVLLIEPERIQDLRQKSGRLRTDLRNAGFELPFGITPIIPVILGDAEKAVACSKKLFDEGFLAPAIRPPTVKAGTCRLRLSVMATHTEEQLQGLVKSMSAFADPSKQDHHHHDHDH